MASDYSSYLRSHLSAKLSKIGLVEDGCHQFGQDLDGHGAMYSGSVIYFRGHGRQTAIAYSVGDGVTCFVGGDDLDQSTYQEWPSLWDLAGMTRVLDGHDPDSVVAYLDQFPQEPDAMLALVTDKLCELLAP